VERAELAVTAALADASIDGVHLMPVTAGGYGVATRLAESIYTLTAEEGKDYTGTL